ncbi:hypothetical protein PILCRDRAFT_815985 [Piloderma croceum F 1598]|uniref:Uncharacterized protein n=1 Tax=Piloderma croceum (strain F 1598) TaxID=765440 RepID=A0A0C3FRZ3_PILCF|nr:hypothetical protein PILCRDRAFT_815985 [Piloderma croceum F 1598]
MILKRIHAPRTSVSIGQLTIALILIVDKLYSPFLHLPFKIPPVADPNLVCPTMKPGCPFLEFSFTLPRQSAGDPPVLALHRSRQCSPLPISHRDVLITLMKNLPPPGCYRKVY